MPTKSILDEGILSRLIDLKQTHPFTEKELTTRSEYFFFAVLRNRNEDRIPYERMISFPVDQSLELDVYYSRKEDGTPSLEAFRESLDSTFSFKGCIHPGLGGLYSSFYEAYETYYVDAFYQKAGAFEEISKFHVSVSKPFRLLRIERLIRNSMAYKGGKDVLPLVEEWFRICDEEGYNLLNVKCDLVMLYANIKNVIFDFYTLRHQRIKIGVEAFEIVSIPSLEELRNWFYAWLNYTLMNFMPIESSSKFAISDVLEFLETHLTEGLSLDNVSAHFLVSSSYLSRRFSDEIGRTFLSYLTELKMKKAMELLKNKCKVGETAHLLGYSDVPHFRKLFKKHYGRLPSQVLG